MRLLLFPIVFVCGLAAVERSHAQHLVSFLIDAGSMFPKAPSVDCEEAYEQAYDASQRLAFSADRLRRCAENESADGCVVELRRVQSDHSAFAKAMAGVNSKCG
ncbi:hypothetical protein [Mesorhizobium sp. Root157]|uniref:hypothetical protein n=1 Tax=Mesorhizobium sp. Root157 TaxID=1736477 RepID=UPI000AC6FD04|nr:hypothetical protein [Mesorhizobium sp. Root157]